MDRETQEVYNKNSAFVRDFGVFLREHKISDVVSLEYHYNTEGNRREYVTVTYFDPITGQYIDKNVNVTLDSIPAIILDITKYGLL